MRGTPSSSSLRMTSCKAGIFFSSASATTTATSQPARIGLGLEGELDGAGAVDEGNGLAHEFGRRDGCFDAHRVRLCFGAVIGNRAAGTYWTLAGMAPVRARIASRRVDLPLAKGPTMATHFGPERLPPARFPMI
jgi:hypothetical protein